MDEEHRADQRAGDAPDREAHRAHAGERAGDRRRARRPSRRPGRSPSAGRRGSRAASCAADVATTPSITMLAASTRTTSVASGAPIAAQKNGRGRDGDRGEHQRSTASTASRRSARSRVGDPGQRTIARLTPSSLKLRTASSASSATAKVPNSSGPRMRASAIPIASVPSRRDSVLSTLMRERAARAGEQRRAGSIRRPPIGAALRSRRAGTPAQTSPAGSTASRRRPCRPRRRRPRRRARAAARRSRRRRASSIVTPPATRAPAPNVTPSPTRSSCVSTTAGITATCSPSVTSAVRTDAGVQHGAGADRGRRGTTAAGWIERRVALGGEPEPLHEREPPARVAGRGHAGASPARPDGRAPPRRAR